MFVKPKDEDVLINLENMESVYLEASESGAYTFITANVRNNDYILGRYKTYKEAKDRFENIIIGLKEKWEVLEL